jgi:hypothetical protein
MEDKLLNAVFRFKHKAASARQDEAMCRALAASFAEFVATLDPIEVAEHKCGRLDPLADDRVVPASSFAVHEAATPKKGFQRLTASDGSTSEYDPRLPQFSKWRQLPRMTPAMDAKQRV